MSLFLDIWTQHGFILASDVRLTTNNGFSYAHKIALRPHGCPVSCAIAVCGEYVENPINYFWNACAANDTLREIARRFAQDWTNRYAATREYSAVHLVGFERIQADAISIPQMWYWQNWSFDTDQPLPEQTLQDQVTSFVNIIPNNNHIPHKILDLTGSPLPHNLNEEADAVTRFLGERGAVFTWNGDRTLFEGTSTAVKASTAIVQAIRHGSLTQLSSLTGILLKFIAQVSNLCGDSTVGLSPEGEIDLVHVTADGASFISRATLP